MVSKKICAASILFFGSAAMADSHGMKHDVKGEFRWEKAEQTVKAGSEDPVNSEVTDTTNAKIDFRFMPSEKVKFRMRLDLMNQAFPAYARDYMNVNYKLSDSMNLTFGTDKVKAFGYARKNSGLTHVSSTVAPSSTFQTGVDNDGNATYTDLGYLSGFGVNYSMGTNSFALQLLRDAEGQTHNAGESRPGTLVALEWMGDFGSVRPLVQYAMYDMQKSNAMTVGVAWSGNNMSLTFDYIMNNVAVNASDDAIKMAYSGFDLDFHMDMGSYSPYFNYSTNAATLDGDPQSKSSNVSVGTYLNYGTEGFRPYVRISQTTSTPEGGDATNTQQVGFGVVGNM